MLNATDHKSVFDNHTTCNYNNVCDKNVCHILMKGGNWE